ncbi:MAG: 7TM diverse intracellular signaling domain-containing protein [Oligoflexus sp.]
MGLQFLSLSLASLLMLCLTCQVKAAERLISGGPLYPSVSILSDPSKKLSLAEIIESSDFTEGRNIIGFKDVSFWVRFDLENPSSDTEDFIFEDQWSLTDFIDFYLISPDGSIDHRELGHRRVEVPGRSLHRYPFANLKLAPGTSTIYIQYRSTDINGTRVALWYPDDFERYKLSSQLIYGILLGALLVMSLYNFFLYITLRYSCYLHYSMYALTFFLFQMCFSGFISQLTGNYLFWIDEGTVLFASTTMMCIIRFTQLFINLKEHSISLDRIGMFLYSLPVTAFILNFFDFQTAAIFTIAGNVALAIWIAFGAILTTYKKLPEGKIFLFAWGAFVVGDLLTISYYTGYNEANLLTQWGMITGVVIEIVLLSFGLSNFVSRMKQAVQEAKEALNRELSMNLSRVEAMVQEKTRDIRLILQNIQQGIFTLYGDKLLVHEEHSKALLPILSNDKVVGQSFVDVFLEKTQIDSDHKSQIISTLTSALNDLVINFESNSHLLPKEIQFGPPEKPLRTLEINWQPMVNAEEIVDRILVTLRDVTDDRELRALAAAHSQDIDLIGEIVQQEPRQFGSFLKTTDKYLQNAHELLGNESTISAEKGRDLFRILHTIKGNSRTLRLSKIATVAHECENCLQLAINQPDLHHFGLDDLQKIEQEIKPYVRVFNQFFNSFDNSRISLEYETARKLILFVQQAGLSQQDPMLSELVNATLHSGKELVKELKRDSQQLALELGKKDPIILDNLESVYVGHDIHEMLQHILGHLLRNSMDHGLESTSDREAQGKPIAGTLNLQYMPGTKECFIWSDDGKGLDLKKIAERAFSKGLIPNPQCEVPVEVCSSVILESGYSTKSTLSEISGRGVGLDAVSDLLHSIGGQLAIRYVGELKQGQWQSFEIVLWLPENQIFQLSEGSDGSLLQAS